MINSELRKRFKILDLHMTMLKFSSLLSSLTNFFKKKKLLNNQKQVFSYISLNILIFEYVATIHAANSIESTILKFQLE